jgi:hypothetical protein
VRPGSPVKEDYSASFANAPSPAPPQRCAPAPQTTLATFTGRLWEMADDVNSVRYKLQEAADRLYGATPDDPKDASSALVPEGSIERLDDAMHVMFHRIEALRAQGLRFADL